ncbi:Glutathione transferase [Heracleum sosnowskyi]|uniref:Probable glutathione S-transferase n=1 Tax=Heracleum sosnowskyi TaxID=360622 RepID=A0AAD8IRT1_9APIA|nr:Glutathione transferase [Heracleum sosnowskyi]
MENSEELKLLGFWVSPTVARVEWALGLKGIKDYVHVEEDVIYNKSPLLLELNPVHKKVPVLVHKGKPIAESDVIVKYIDETWKNYPLLPQDPYEKARILSFAKFGDKLFDDAFTAMWSQGEEKEKVVKSTIEEFEKIEEEIKGRKFFGGESIGYLDIALGWISYWLPLWEEVGSINIFDPIKFPGIASWVENFLSQPVINEKLPPKDRAVEYFQERRAFITSVIYV